MKDNLKVAQQHAVQYWLVDGLNELALAGLCVLLGAYFYVQATLSPDSAAYKILDMSFVLIIIGGGLLVNRLVQVFKEQLTYPRTGFVSYRRAYGLNRWVRAVFTGGIAALMGAFLTYAFSNASAAFAWMPAVTGLVFGMVMLFIAARSALLRFYLLAAAAVLLGGGLTLAGIGNVLGLAVFYAGQALCLFVTGAWTLRSYLHDNRPPAEEAHE